MDDDSRALLHNYAASQDQFAFQRLVELHSGLVFSTALRRLNGDRGLAEDVLQEVFNQLARKAKLLAGEVCPASWLYRQTCRLSGNKVRSERRRVKRELVAADYMNSKTESSQSELIEELDEALLSLSKEARDVVVMRFFEEKSHDAVGKVLGISEEAARKRVTRALKSLKLVLERRGLRISIPMLTAALMSLNTRSASAVLAGKVATQAMTHPVANASLAAMTGAFIAGAFGISVMAGGVQYVQSSAKYFTPTALKQNSPSTHREEESKEATHLDIIAQIKRLTQRPNNVMMRLELATVLEGVSNDEIEDFLDFSSQDLNRLQRELTYRILFSRWMEANPEEAMTASLEKNLQGLIQPNFLGNLTCDLFELWADKNAESAVDWLLANWGHPILLTSTKYYLGAMSSWSYQEEMARRAVKLVRENQSIEKALSLSGRFSEETQEVIQSALYGCHYGMTEKPVFVAEDAEVLYRHLESIQSDEVRDSLEIKFWKMWKRTDADGAERFLENLNSNERIRARFSLLAGLHRFDALKKAPHMPSLLLDGEAYQTSSPREHAALVAVLEEGMNGEDALNKLGKHYLEHSRDNKPLLRWLGKYGVFLNLEEELLSRQSYVYLESDNTTDFYAAEASIGFARYLKDPILRNQISRASFRRLIAMNMERAQSVMNDATLPEELRASFQNILEEAE